MYAKDMAAGWYVALATDYPFHYVNDGRYQCTARTKAEVVEALGSAGCSVFIDATPTYSNFYYTAVAVNGSIDVQESPDDYYSFPLLYQAIVP
jgi:hypothetical protein